MRNLSVKVAVASAVPEGALKKFHTPDCFPTYDATPLLVYVQPPAPVYLALTAVYRFGLP